MERALQGSASLNDGRAPTPTSLADTQVPPLSVQPGSADDAGAPASSGGYPNDAGDQNAGGAPMVGVDGRGGDSGVSLDHRDAGEVPLETGGAASCTPQCEHKQCGDDGCGQACGACDDDQDCNADQQCIQVEFQLEDSDLSGSAAAETTGTGWTGTGYADFLRSEGMVTTTVSPGAGNWDVNITYATGGLRDLDIRVNGTLVTTHSFRQTGSWSDHWKIDSIPQVKLNAGNNIIELATNGDSGPNLDKLTLSPSAGYSVLVEAEAYDVRGCSGEKPGDGGTIVVYCYDGAVNTYTVMVPASGPATFAVRASTGNVDAQLQVLNESDDVLATLFIPPRGWDKFGKHSVRLPSLSAGTTILKLRTHGAAADTNWWRLDQQ